MLGWQRLLILCVALAAPAAAQAQALRFIDGTVPALAQDAIGGGEVFLELTLDGGGRVERVTRLRTTPPFTDLVVEAVRDWRFAPSPASADPGPRLLVAAVYRAPVLLGPTLGAIPRDEAAPSAEIPFPTSTVVPPFPPMAASGGVVLVDAEIDDRGSVAAAAIASSYPPFDGLALDAAWQWKFRPAAPRQQPGNPHVVLVFGFPLPIAPPPLPKKP